MVDFTLYLNSDKASEGTYSKFTTVLPKPLYNASRYVVRANEVAIAPQPHSGLVCFVKLNFIDPVMAGTTHPSYVYTPSR